MAAAAAKTLFTARCSSNNAAPSVSTTRGARLLGCLPKKRKSMKKLGKMTAAAATGLAEELSKEGACDQAIFPDSNIVITRCAIGGNLNVEGGDRCNLDLVPGCTNPNTPQYDPLANVDVGSCPVALDSEE